jgi:hypothetical protein
MPAGQLTGGCLCGAVRYSVAGRPRAPAVCHCEDCRRQSGSAFSVFFLVRDDELELDGDLATYVTIGERTGFRRERRFCPACGSPVLSRLEEMPGMAFLKAGTLDDGDRVRPAIEFYRASAQRWIRRPLPRIRLRRGPSPRATALLRRMTR